MASSQTKLIPPINWNAPIIGTDGKPTKAFIQAWNRITKAAGSIPDLPTDAAGMSALLDLLGSTPNTVLIRGASQWEDHPPTDALDIIGSVRGDLLARKTSAWGRIASPSDTTKFLNGALDPVWGSVHDSDLSLSDITNNNVSTGAHGFAPKLPNDATKFLNGAGAYAVPPGTAAASLPIFMQAPYMNLTSVATIGPSTATLLEIIPPFNLTMTGIKAFVVNAGVSRTIAPCLYADGGTRTPAGGALLAAGAAVAAAGNSINTLPFASPVNLLKDTIYWLGIDVLGGSGNLQLAAGDVTRNGYYFFTQGSLPFANPAPAATSGTGGTAFTWWGY